MQKHSKIGWGSHISWLYRMAITPRIPDLDAIFLFYSFTNWCHISYAWGQLWHPAAMQCCIAEPHYGMMSTLYYDVMMQWKCNVMIRYNSLTPKQSQERQLVPWHIYRSAMRCVKFGVAVLKVSILKREVSICHGYMCIVLYIYWSDMRCAKFGIAVCKASMLH